MLRRLDAVELVRQLVGDVVACNVKRDAYTTRSRSTPTAKKASKSAGGDARNPQRPSDCACVSVVDKRGEHRNTAPNSCGACRYVTLASANEHIVASMASGGIKRLSASSLVKAHAKNSRAFCRHSREAIDCHITSSLLLLLANAGNAIEFFVKKSTTFVASISRKQQQATATRSRAQRKTPPRRFVVSRFSLFSSLFLPSFST